ncbi:hypothetical protein Tco_0428450 [Tanacetum coccineum]
MTEKVRVVLNSVVGVEEGKSVLCEGVNGMRNSVCRLVLLELIIRFVVATAARSITSSVAVTATFGGEENHRFSQGRYLALKAKEETELILWKSRRRKRKYNNAIVTIN